MNIRDCTCRISIAHKDTIYKILSIWYHKDGGYYISDLGNESFDYLAMKLSTDIKAEDKDWIFYIPYTKNPAYSIKLRKPKISHHIDWTSHISGEWINSGYSEDGTSKGLSLKSFELTGYNDWWPVFCCSVRADSLEKFQNIKLSELEDDNKLFKKFHLTIPTGNLPYINGPFNYIIEWYYIHKSHLPDSEFMNEHKPLFNKVHPRFWNITLCPIYSPEVSPYIFGIHLRKEKLIWPNTPILSFWACPGIVRDDGNWDTITLSVHDKEPEIDKISLNYDI